MFEEIAGRGNCTVKRRTKRIKRSMKEMSRRKREIVIFTSGFSPVPKGSKRSFNKMKRTVEETLFYKIK